MDQNPGRHPLVGVVGLGLVGTALLGRLRAAAWPVTGTDTRAEAMQTHRASGVECVDSVRELSSRCEALVLAVYDTAGVLDAVEGPHGLAADTTVRVVIDCSTGDPDRLAALGERLARRGIDFIEAPLSGSSTQIAAGQATLLIGASDAALARHSALLQVLGAQRVHVGGAGMGARAKLATNLVLGLNRAALAEGMVLAERMGIEPARFLQIVLATPARSDAALLKGPLMARGDFTPQSRIHQHLKDVLLMLEQACASGQRLPLSEAHAALMRAAIAAGDGELDNAAIIRQIRREKP